VAVEQVLDQRGRPGVGQVHPPELLHRADKGRALARQVERVAVGRALDQGARDRVLQRQEDERDAAEDQRQQRQRRDVLDAPPGVEREAPAVARDQRIV
jgi:hypothetical protein